MKNVHVAFAVNFHSNERWFADAKAAAKFAGEHSMNGTGFVFQVRGNEAMADEFCEAGEAFFRSRQTFVDAKTRAAAHRTWCNFCQKHR